jgi:hypothetical protein
MKLARRRPLLKAIFLVSLIALGGAAISFAAEPLARFPFVFDGRIIVPLRVNDSPPLDTVLDTGFPQKVLMLFHKETGDELGLTYVRTVNAARGAGSGENKPTRLTAGERLALPGLDLGKLTTAVVDESRAVSPMHNAGIIGGAVFIPYVVEVDFERSLITLYDPKSFAPEAGWEEVLLVFERNIPVIETTLRLGDGAEVPVRLIVDTGGKPQLALVANVGRKIAPAARVVRFLSGTGFRGDVIADHGRLAELRFGSHRLSNVVTAFWNEDVAPALGETKTDGPLGLGTLYRFNLIFDYTRGRMFIKPNRYYADPFELNMAGMAVGKTVSGETVVQFVMEGSEAAKKGLRKGDVVAAVDGKAAGSYGFLELKRKFERAGKTVKVKVERDGVTREVRLKLKRII